MVHVNSTLDAELFNNQTLNVKDVAAIRDENKLLRLIELRAYRSANLLNISSLSSELEVDRAAEKYLTILERLFLIRR